MAQYLMFKPFGGRGALRMKSTQSFTLLPARSQFGGIRLPGWTESLREHTDESRMPVIVKLLAQSVFQARGSGMKFKARAGFIQYC